MKNRICMLAFGVALSTAGPAVADTTWTLAATGTVNGSGGSAVTAGATGWANTSGSGSDPTLYTLREQTATSFMTLYSGGLGINNRDGCTTAFGTCDVGDMASTAPEHAIDNDQRYEMVLVQFSQKVSLTTVSTKWTGTDADITVLAYSGSVVPALYGQQWGALTAASGWNVVANYTGFSASKDTLQNASISNAPSSSYWLIGAFNPLVSTNKTGGIVGDGSADYLKLFSVAGKVSSGDSSVPEPSTLALFGAALLGMIGLRRRALA